MIDEYTIRRAELIKELSFLLEKRLYLSAKARIRKIADIDYEQRGIDREITKEKFNYYKLK